MPHQPLPALGIALALSAAAFGQASDSASSATPAPMSSETSAVPELTVTAPSVAFRFTGGAWFPRLRGESSKGGPSIDVGSFGLDGSETAPVLDLEISIDRLGILLSGFTFSTDGSGVMDEDAVFGAVNLPVGATVNSSFDFDSAGVEFTYALWRPGSISSEQDAQARRSGRIPGAPGSGLTISPLAGARWIHIEEEVSVPGGASDSGGGDWAALLFGLQVEIDLVFPRETPIVHGLSINGRAAYGPALGSDIGTALEIQADLTLWFTPNIGVTGGYRYFGADVSDGDWSFDGRIPGVFVSGTIRF